LPHEKTIDPHYWLKNPNPCLPHPELKRLKARTTEIVEAESLTFSVRRPGPPQGEDIEIQLVSGNDHQRQTAANAWQYIVTNCLVAF
jgi:hypothetical protein